MRHMRSTGIAMKVRTKQRFLRVVEEVHDIFKTAGLHFARCLGLPPHRVLVRLHELLMVQFGLGSATGEVRPHSWPTLAKPTLANSLTDFDQLWA